MVETLTLANIAAYSAQVICVVALSTILAWVLRLDVPAIRYGFWRMVLALCLLLPLLQGRERPSLAANPTTTSVMTRVTPAQLASNPAASLLVWADMVV